MPSYFDLLIFVQPLCKMEILIALQYYTEGLSFFFLIREKGKMFAVQLLDTRHRTSNVCLFMSYNTKK